MTGSQSAIAELVEALREEVRAEAEASPPVPDQLLSIDEAAELVGVARTKLYGLLSGGPAPVAEGRSKATGPGPRGPRVHRSGPAMTLPPADPYGGRATSADLNGLPSVEEPTDGEVSELTRRYVEAVAAEHGIDLSELPYHRTPKVSLPSFFDAPATDAPIVWTVRALAELPSAEEEYIVADGILTRGREDARLREIGCWQDHTARLHRRAACHGAVVPRGRYAVVAHAACL